MQAVVTTTLNGRDTLEGVIIAVVVEEVAVEAVLELSVVAPIL